jgi:hypothetical protein
METKKLTQQQEDLLRSPLPAEAVSKHPTKTYLSSIKAIYVIERLNQVFGIGSWKVKSEIIDNKTAMIVVRVTLSIPEYGIELESFGGNDNGGENSKNYDLGDAYKGATTDAITKIGSYLEIGIDVFKGKIKTPFIKLAQKETIKPAQLNQAINRIKSGEKETIKPAQLNQAINRIKSGEKELIKKLIETYDLSPVELKQLQEA